MSLATFTQVHVLLSLIGIAAGFVATVGWIGGRTMETWTRIFLTSTILTSVTGFGFPFSGILPGHIFGVVSLIVLPVALAARYKYRLQGRWQRTFVICSVFALYLNSFVGVVQAFLKIPALTAIAPTQSEAPFVAAQVALLALTVVLTILVEFRVRRLPVHPAKA
ncbi:MAG: hypothetical protein K2X03_11305 [Bryobacteraceae bacterium]|nr:hypothetical protein [Bryobacteraceae bacterium]